MLNKRLLNPKKELRDRLEQARLNLLALFRGLDRIDIATTEMPQSELRVLMELDADCAEALWALDNPHGLSMKKMIKDTESSLQKINKSRQIFLEKLSKRVSATFLQHEIEVRASLSVTEAYNGVPGRDPEA